MAANYSKVCLASGNGSFTSSSGEILVSSGVPVPEGMGVLCEPLFVAGPFDIYLCVYKLFFLCTSESENAAGAVHDTTAAEVAVADAVGAGDEETVGVGVGDGVDVQHGEVVPALVFRDPVVGGVGGDAEEICTADRQGPGRLWEPGVVTDENPDPTERGIEGRQVTARLVE